jgi:hypothetical protein
MAPRGRIARADVSTSGGGRAMARSARRVRPCHWKGPTPPGRGARSGGCQDAHPEKGARPWSAGTGGDGRGRLRSGVSGEAGPYWRDQAAHTASAPWPRSSRPAPYPSLRSPLAGRPGTDLLFACGHGFGISAILQSVLHGHNRRSPAWITYLAPRRSPAPKRDPCTTEMNKAASSTLKENDARYCS